LLAEHNVTRAARRLHLSQPSVSVQLAKLREAFGDPLLLPGPRGMRPTARADALRAPLHAALQALRGAISAQAPFDPALATHTWRIAASDYGASALLLPALASLRAAAPGTRLAILSVPPAHIATQAEQGAIDLAFHTADNAPPGLRSRALLQESYVLVGRAGHPALESAPTLAQFLALEHAITSPDGGELRADAALAALGLARRVVLSVPNFLLLKAVLASTDLVALLPARLVAGSPQLAAVAPPMEIPGFAMVMLWPERVHRDPAHAWLRAHLGSELR
jgi:DNA-binding transcriptional LysR family regulator